MPNEGMIKSNTRRIERLETSVAELPVKIVEMKTELIEKFDSSHETAIKNLTSVIEKIVPPRRKLDFVWNKWTIGLILIAGALIGERGIDLVKGFLN